MELKDKILEAMDTQMPRFEPATDTHISDAAESIVKICDDEMIRFAEWCADEGVEKCSTPTFYRFGVKYYSMPELLQLFKQNQ